MLTGCISFHKHNRQKERYNFSKSRIQLLFAPRKEGDMKESYPIPLREVGEWGGQFRIP
jgi:hypothetical protein